ncbi:O-antigen ligase family protein [Curtobacterium sp. VKM Ac-1376]|uniref:O-antigen ligase family protein n=1 Tax=Curtobacterium sp. VKM Ac-1376 TaxID=123312 RepID=UPI00188B2BCC|nr:hypothetical protein [Curtobacterium sp. VKM Ac-1376]MBF4614147.1 hypothetical protein [Curtobacterium sp. VKM Ac-1376]
MKAESRATLIRFVLFAAGYLLLFQTDSSPAGVKEGYVAVSVGFASVAAFRLRKLEEQGVPRGVFVSVGIMLLLLLLWSARLISGGVAIEDWIRDALNYILFPVALLIGADAGTSLRRGFVGKVVLIVGVFGAFTFMETWLARRSGEMLGYEQVGLASSFVPLTSICLCLAVFFAGERWRGAALLLALGQMVLLAVSGGRTVWIYCVTALLASFLAAAVPLGVRLGRAAVALGATLFGVTVVFSLSTAIGGGIANARIASLKTLADGGVQSLLADGSAIERIRAYQWTAAIWQEHPLIGRGLGYTFPSVTTGNFNAGIYTLDTPIVVLAKFGVLGTLLILAAIAVLWWTLRVGSGGDRTGRAFLITLTIVVLVLVPNGFPIENRGFDLLVCMGVAYVLAAGTRSSPSSTAPDLKLEETVG